MEWIGYRIVAEPRLRMENPDPLLLSRKIQAVEASIRALIDLVDALQRRMRQGDKQAYRTMKVSRLQLSRLRQERSELTRRERRSVRPSTDEVPLRPGMAP